jgi:RNA polymerase sigma factor (TIGR02999 family)
MGDLTELIQQGCSGDVRARDEAFKRLYGDLKRLARAHLSRGGRDAQLDTVAVVNEAYLRLSQSGELKPDDRYRYLAYVGRAMRSVVVDYLRARAAERRGGRAHHMSLDTQIADSVPSDEAHVLQVHEALEELASVDARMVNVVEMKYFAGLGEREIAGALGVTERTVRRDWEKARLLLSAALR